MNLKKITFCLSCTLLSLISFDLSHNDLKASEDPLVSLNNLNQPHDAKVTNNTNSPNIPLYQKGQNNLSKISDSKPLFVGPLNVVPLNEAPLKMHPLNKVRPTIDKHISNTNIDITGHLRLIQILLNNIELDRLENTVSTSVSAMLSESDQSINQTSNKSNQIGRKIVSLDNSKIISPLKSVGYWQTVYSIESKQGKLLYRPKNKARNCSFTKGPCGHHQLTVQALKDIGCKSLQCRKDRLDYNKSLSLSKKLLALNEKRLRKNGLSNLEGYQKYLIHQQGANGIKNIIAATKGKKQLPSNIKKNMANNSPYSYRQYKKMGSKVAAKKFMMHWERKWQKEKRLILASAGNSTNSLKKSIVIPTFSDNDLNFALNIKF